MELYLTRPLVFFDIETTGLHVGTDRIVEISFFKLKPDGSQELINQRFNPTIPISPEASKVHGITDADVVDKPTFKELAPTYNQFLINCDLAGYNCIKFDVPLLVEEFLRADIDFELSGRRIIDVQNIFHKMEPRTLSAAYRFYCNQDLENAHSAEADTIATFEILKAQLDKYQNTYFEDKNGQKTLPVVNEVQALHDFSFQTRNVDLIGHIIYNENDIEVFNFGKHKGKAVSQVFKDEPSYYDWMMKADFPLSTKKVITALKLRMNSNFKIQQR